MGIYTEQDCLNEISRISQAANDIKGAIEAKGVSVPDNTPLSDYDDLIRNIPGGEGGSVVIPGDLALGFNDKYTEFPSNWVWEERTTCENMFNGCSSLTSIPNFSINPGCTSITGMFSVCTHLQTFPSMVETYLNNPSNQCRSVANAFDSTGLYSIPDLMYLPDYLTYTFNGCPNLTSTGTLGFKYSSSGLVMDYMLSYCYNLKTVSFNFGQCVFNNNDICPFGIGEWGDSNLENLTDLTIYGQLNVNSNQTFYLDTLPNLNYTSIQSILEAANNTSISNPGTIAFNCTISDQGGQLAALKATCESKGWTINGLSIS